MNRTITAESKTVLVTGANGFVGQSLCAEILKQGWHVKAAARSSCQLPAGAEPVIVGAIDDETDWTDALHGVDVVIHLAARVHVMKDDAANSLAAFRYVNIFGTERLARMAATSGVRRFVYMSTVKVNGAEASAPYTEQDIPAPEDPYGISKWEAEQALQEIAQRTGLEVVVLRPPLVYGPGVKANFERLLETIYHGIPLPLSNIDNRRSLIYLENLVDAIVTCINNPKAAGQTYLVSDGDDVSTPELVRRVAAALGKPARLFPFPPALMRLAGKLIGKSAAMEKVLGSLTVDSGKIRRELQWKAPHTMMQGLKETADWYLKGRLSVA